MKAYISILIVTVLYLLLTSPVYAGVVQSAGASAGPAMTLAVVDSRVTKLRAFLESHGSPLAPSAEHFIAEADRLGLDWKLVAAISGVESTFGKHVPRNSYNGWGWAIYTGKSDGKHFADWNDGITTVSEGLKFRYIDRGATSVEAIGRIYAASPLWSAKVRFFLNKIEDFSPMGVDHLALTI